MQKRILSLTLVLALCLSLLPATALAAQSGENWTLDDNGILTLYDGFNLGSFSNLCSSVKRVVFACKQPYEIGTDMFNAKRNYWDNLSSIELADGLTSIGDEAFNALTGLRSITIPGSCKSIGNGAFFSCTALSDVTLEYGVETVGNNAFGGCASLRNITIPSSVKTIGKSAFSACTGLRSITIPNGVTTIGEWAFNDCVNLESVNFPTTSMTLTIDNMAFKGCASLTSITIPDSVANVKNRAFQNSGLTSVTIQSSETSLDPHAFDDCGNLTEVHFPKGMTKKGLYFTGSSIKDIYYDGTVTEWCGNKYDKMSDLGSGVTLHCTDGNYKDGDTVPYYSLSSRFIQGSGRFSIKQGDTLRVHIAYITNNGNTTVTLVPPASNSFDLNLSETTLQPGASASLTVQPKENLRTGTYEEQLAIATTNGLATTKLDLFCEISEMGVFSVNPSVLDYGTVQEGVDNFELKKITITNNSNTDLRFYSPTDKAFTENYHLFFGTYDTTLSPGASKSFYIYPRNSLKAGNYDITTFITARTTLRSTDDGTAISARLQLKYTVGGETAISVSPGSLDFGLVKEGDAQPEPQTVTVTNTSETRVTLTAPQSSNYIISSFHINSDSNQVNTIAPGETATFTVQPKTGLREGSYDTTLTVYGNNKTVSADVPVKHTVTTGYIISASPSVLDFGTVKENESQPDAQTVTVTNIGNFDVTLNAPGSANYSISSISYSKRTLAPGDSVSFTVQPKAGLKPGSYDATLYISSDRKASAKVSLKYTVTGILSVSPTSLDFGTAQEGDAQPAAKTVTVTNTGGTNVTLNAPSSTNYDIGSLSNSTLSAGQTATFTVQPKAGLNAGYYNETLTIAGTDGKVSFSVPIKYKVEEKEGVMKPLKGPTGFTGQIDFEFSNACLGCVKEDGETVYYYPSGTALTLTITPAAETAPTFAPTLQLDGTTVSEYANPYRGPQTYTFTLSRTGLYHLRLDKRYYPPDEPFVQHHFYFRVGSDSTASTTGFSDIPANSYYANPVAWAVETGVTRGITDTTFGPDRGCTRAQIVTFLWRANGSPEPVSHVHPFTDVKEDFYYDAMLWAVESGVTSGTTSTTFEPDSVCTRAQIVTFLWRANGSPEPANRVHPFTDVKEDFYFDAMLWAVESGVTSGTTATTFEPSSGCTRAQAVTFLYRAT